MGTGEPTFRQVVLGVVLGSVFVISAGLAGEAITASTVPSPSLFMIGFAISVLEEVLFRGVILPTSAERFGIVMGIIISALSFGLAHLLFGGGWFLFGLTTVFGLFVSYVVLATGSLLPAISAHVTYNTIMMLLWFV
ncbi:MAG: CPBP family intramembrane metalloprotease [Deltaproteobacteria bacterium]|nr:CPBP family intramembrane metalloprotease [Deltaproteobacteria bacterium]